MHITKNSRGQRWRAAPEFGVMPLSGNKKHFMEKALLIIDMQNEFCLKNEKDIGYNYSSIVAPINAISSHFRGNEWKVFWVNWGVDPSLESVSEFQKEKFNNYEYPPEMNWKRKLNGSKKVLEKSSWSASILSSLKKDKSDIYVSKQTISGFHTSNLDKKLKEYSLKELYFAGINLDQCVLATLLDAHCLGYDCILLEDCTSTSSPDYCRQAVLYNVDKLFGNRGTRLTPDSLSLR
ncbi:cysteine hydrolase family protein [Endozoicomonas numazuensis]|uniref:cysteine hydrolase family protein n=1 Tax=Endozoicomonas numazuensis TaxID=1137799 RepID=UPI001376B289|nr:cysteine hydrolase family protein [Endozoicomonas numazuensis]